MNKPQLESQHVIDELTAVVNSLGKLDENDGTYMKDRDCKPCLREMLRYLNADSNKHVARSTLGALNVIKSDLIPLMVQYCDFNEGDPELFNTILRLCANLTSPVLLLFENQEMPSEPEQLQLYNKLLTYLYGYKQAFAINDKIWSTLNVHLRHNADDEITFERLIILIRNILHIPVDSTADMGMHADFDAHDMCLYRMDKGGMLNTIIKIASETQKGTEFCFHLTEVIYLMLRDQNPETLATAKDSIYKKKLDNNDVDKKRYAELSARNRREREANKIQPIRLKGATFVDKNCRSLGEAQLVLHKPLGSREMIKFDKGKVDLRKAKNKKPLSSETSMIISDQNTKSSKVSYSLKVFCKQYVEKIYNNYMQQLKHNLIQKKAQENDESYYLWAIQFFTSFNRHLSMSIDHISETLSTSTLHFIQILISSYQDKLEVEKKKFHDVSKRLHLAIRAYREILYLIKSVDPSSDFSRTVETIKRNIFTETEYSTLILNLLQKYDEPKHSSHYLRDLIQTNHIFLDLLEDYSGNNAAVEAEGDVSPSEKGPPKKRAKKSIDFRAAHFMSRYCHPDVIKSHLDVLHNFKSNEDSTNLAILKFLERIVYDCKNEVILFQASIFKCLLEIMNYHSSMPGHNRFTTLGKHLMEKFGSMANKRRWMFQELLFWKTGNDVVDIENAIDPPAVIPVDDLSAERDQPPLESDDAPPDEFETQPPADTIADLMAELNDSDDDEAYSANPLREPPADPPADSIENLRAELNDSDDDEIYSANPTSESQADPSADYRESLRAQLMDSDDDDEYSADLLPELEDDPPTVDSIEQQPANETASSPLSDIPDTNDCEETSEI